MSSSDEFAAMVAQQKTSAAALGSVQSGYLNVLGGLGRQGSNVAGNFSKPPRLFERSFEVRPGMNGSYVVLACGELLGFSDLAGLLAYFNAQAQAEDEIAADAANRIATAKAMGANMPESVAVRAAVALVRLLREEAAKK